MGVDGVNATSDYDCLQTLFKWLVLVLELKGLDFIGNMETVNPIAEGFDGLNDLAHGVSGGVEVDVGVVAREEQLCGVGSVSEGSGLSLEVDHVVVRLFGLLVHEAVLTDRVNRHF